MRITLIGTGEIARKMADTINQLTNDFTLYGVVSRSQERGESFKEEYNAKKVFTSLQEVIDDSMTDLVYIGTPHTLHFEQSKFFLEHKIPVLCEKPICVNADEFKNLIEISNQHQTLLVDATWSRYMPFVNIVKELPKKYGLGKLLNIHSSLGIQKQNVDRMINPQLAGGSLLDVGIYPLTVACMFNENPIMDVQSMSLKTETGVDETVIFHLRFSDGAMASLQSSIGSIMTDVSTLSYENGLINLHGIPNVEKVVVKNSDHKVLEQIHFENITGYEYELFETKEAIHDQELSVKSLKHEETLRVLQTMDKIREQIDLIYPFEKER